MNYRHHFHAGNFADVFKHLLLVQLFRAMQRKETGFLYLDTHAGRGGYDLDEASVGSRLERQPEHPDGIGRLEKASELADQSADYLSIVRAYDRARGNLAPGIRFYPGSPELARAMARSQDRLVFCEKHPEDLDALRNTFERKRGISVQDLDGYTAPRAMLPPPEKRALVLIDPPFEAQTEWEDCVQAVGEALRRLPAAVVALWYPLTDRARADALLTAIRTSRPGPALLFELTIAGPASGIRMRGCGLLVVNPPWRLEEGVRAAIQELPGLLGRDSGASAHTEWLIPE